LFLNKEERIFRFHILGYKKKVKASYFVIDTLIFFRYGPLPYLSYQIHHENEEKQHNIIMKQIRTYPNYH